MRIAFLIDRMWGANGGTEGQLLMLIKHLDPARFDVHLVCLRDTEWLHGATLPCPVTVLHVGSLVRPSIVSRLLAFKRFLKEQQIDLIQTYFDDAFIFGAIAGRMAGVPVISCRRNLGPAFWGKRGYLRAFRLIQPITSRYLVNSEATRESIASTEGIPQEKIQVVYNGLDLSRFNSITPELRQSERQKLGVRDDNVLIGMVSHLRREKNLELFVDAAVQLRTECPQARWVILGDGWYRPILETYIRERNLQNIMSLPGATQDVVPFLAAIDIAALTSDGESFSNAIIEYMAAGLPAVATGVGGTVEALKETGFLFPPGDLNRLVELLTYLIGNPQARRAAGENGKLESTRKYSITRMVTAHENVYSEYLPKQVQDLITAKK